MPRPILFALSLSLVTGVFGTLSKAETTTRRASTSLRFVSMSRSPQSAHGADPAQDQPSGGPESKGRTIQVPGVRLTLRFAAPTAAVGSPIPGVTLRLLPRRPSGLPPVSDRSIPQVPGVYLRLMPATSVVRPAEIPGVTLVLSPPMKRGDPPFWIDTGFTYHEREFPLTSSAETFDTIYNFIPVSPVPFESDASPRRSDLLPAARVSLAAPMLTLTAFLPELHWGAESVIVKPQISVGGAPVWFDLGAADGSGLTRVSTRGALLGASPEVALKLCRDCRWGFGAAAGWWFVPRSGSLEEGESFLPFGSALRSQLSMDYFLRSFSGRIQRRSPGGRLLLTVGFQVEKSGLRLETLDEVDFGLTSARRREDLRFRQVTTMGLFGLKLKLKSRSAASARFLIGRSGFTVDFRIGAAPFSKWPF